MKYDRRKSPAEFATTGYAFPEVGWDTVEGRTYLFSTDGRAAILVEAEAGDDVEAETLFRRTIPAPVFDCAKKNPVQELIVSGETVSIGPLTYSTTARGPIPSISTLLRGLTPCDDSRGFDALLVARIQKALGASAVSLQFHGPREPIIVRGIYGAKARGLADSSFGLLMPFA
jgi:hypothetical protein